MMHSKVILFLFYATIYTLVFSCTLKDEENKDELYIEVDNSLGWERHLLYVNYYNSTNDTLICLYWGDVVSKKNKDAVGSQESNTEIIVEVGGHKLYSKDIIFKRRRQVGPKNPVYFIPPHSSKTLVLGYFGNLYEDFNINRKDRLKVSVRIEFAEDSFSERINYYKTKYSKYKFLSDTILVSSFINDN